MGVASHVRGGPPAATLVLATGPGTSWSHLQPRAPPQQHLPPWLGLSPPSWPQGAPLGSWGLCTPLTVWRPRREAMASPSAPGSPVTRAHTGEGMRVAEAAV